VAHSDQQLLEVGELIKFEVNATPDLRQLFPELVEPIMCKALHRVDSDTFSDEHPSLLAIIQALSRVVKNDREKPQKMRISR
jgi:hypothetical protein